MIDVIDLTWNDLDIAKENLQRINEHYKQYNELNSYRGRDRDSIMDENKNKEWFVFKEQLYHKDGYVIDECHKEKVGDNNWLYKPNYDACAYNIRLKTDDGKPYQMSAFWCGYFESLHYAEIILDNSDMRIEF